jgi:hypothetical protein
VTAYDSVSSSIGSLSPFSAMRRNYAQELERRPEQDLDRLMAFLRSLADAHAEAAVPAAAAESSLAKDWLTPEEDAAWASW